MTFRGTIVNGRVELEAGVQLPEGTAVKIEALRAGRNGKKPARTPRKASGLLRLAQVAVNTGIRDLAAEHDHYIYGTPKRGKQPRRKRA